MARYRRYRGSVGDEMQRGLTQLVTLAISLYAFDILLDAIMPTLYTCSGNMVLNTSTLGTTTVQCYNASTTATATGSAWFGVAISFIEALLPVVGILGGYKIIKNVLRNVNR